jgi:hypothetical protein
MANCPQCRRPVAVARAACLYCGAPLPPQGGTTAAAAPATAMAELPAAVTDLARPAPMRTLVVLDLDGVDPTTLAPVLSLPAYEAALLARRAGLQLHRVLDPEAAAAEARRLAADGLVVFLVPEAEARVRPVRATGGERTEGALALRTEEGPLTVRGEDLLLVVRGPIARHFRPSLRWRKVDTATLEEGYRVHLHRRLKPRPIELDATNFEFGFAVTGSGRLELDAWVEALAPGVPRDEGFRRLPPALGPAEPEPKGPLAAAASLGRTTRDRGAGTRHEPLLLDNAEQFRFYSAWRAAVERRRAGA